MDLLKMAAALNHRSTDPHLPYPSHGANNVGESLAALSLSESSKRGRTAELPLPPRHKSRISFTLEEAIEYELKHGRKVDPNMDMKHLRRTISNRLSALRSRVRRFKYTSDMEKMVKGLEDKIKGLAPQIKLYEDRRKELLMENASLRRRIEISSNEATISESKMLLEQKQLEICRLKEEEEAAARGMYININRGEEVMQDLTTVNQPAPVAQPYTIEFYQNSLPKFEANQMRQGQPSSSVQVQVPEPEPPTVLENHEEEDIVDQYLNFDELFLDELEA